MFLQALADGTMECYYPLSEQFLTQSEPSYCAISTLTMCLNALAVDPKSQWKSPWRWFSEEKVECCRPLSLIQQEGMNFKQFSALARCNGVYAEDYRAEESTMEHFREAVIKVSTADSVVFDGHASSAADDEERGGLKHCLAVSYSRKTLKQTGDGHMSPIAGYHHASDSVLILDVARFKYPPYWVTIEQLWNAMLPHDKTTGKSRGYCVFSTAFPDIDTESEEEDDNKARTTDRPDLTLEAEEKSSTGYYDYQNRRKSFAGDNGDNVFNLQRSIYRDMACHEMEGCHDQQRADCEKCNNSKKLLRKVSKMIK